MSDATNDGPARAFPYDDFLFAATHLCEVLEVENEALAKHQVDGVRDLYDTKLALTRLYEQSLRPLAEDPSLVETLEPDQRDELRQMGARMEALVRANAQLLSAGMDASKRAMEVVVGAVKQHTSNTVAYGRAGTYDQAGKAPQANSLSFNKTL